MKKALIILLALAMLLFACTVSFAENAATSNAVELAVVGEDEIVLLKPICRFEPAQNFL